MGLAFSLFPFPVSRFPLYDRRRESRRSADVAKSDVTLLEKHQFLRGAMG